MSDLLPQRVRWLVGAHLPDGSTVDVQLDGGRVASVHPAGTPDIPAADDVLDLDGYLLLPAAAEPHAHLDKALSYDLIQPPHGDLESAIEFWRRYAATMSVDDILGRARRTVRRMLANGTTAIRSHVDVLTGPQPTRSAEALVRLREEFAGIVDLELVALASWRSTDAEIEAVLDVGVDLMGGCPHLAPDPDAELRRVLAIADRRNLGIDLHTDENLDGALTLGAFARAVRGWQRPVSAGHCVRLGTLAPADLTPVLAEVAASDIGVISLPITNLYLQGRNHPVSTPRGLTALRALLDAGIRVAAGADNVRDPFNPVGRCDPLETASLLVTAGHLDLPTAIALVTDGARDVLGLLAAGPQPGYAAEFLAVRAANLGEAIAFAPLDRVVIAAGRVVARTSVHTELAGTAFPAQRPQHADSSPLQEVSRA